MSEELYKRNRFIFMEKIKGATYRELGIKYQLSLDRVFKIVQRENLRDSGELEEYKAKRRIRIRRNKKRKIKK